MVDAPLLFSSDTDNIKYKKFDRSALEAKEKWQTGVILTPSFETNQAESKKYNPSKKRINYVMKTLLFILCLVLLAAISYYIYSTFAEKLPEKSNFILKEKPGLTKVNNFFKEFEDKVEIIDMCPLSGRVDDFSLKNPSENYSNSSILFPSNFVSKEVPLQASTPSPILDASLSKNEDIVNVDMESDTLLDCTSTDVSPKFNISENQTFSSVANATNVDETNLATILSSLYDVFFVKGFAVLLAAFNFFKQSAASSSNSFVEEYRLLTMRNHDSPHYMLIIGLILPIFLGILFISSALLKQKLANNKFFKYGIFVFLITSIIATFGPLFFKNSLSIIKPQNIINLSTGLLLIFSTLVYICHFVYCSPDSKLVFPSALLTTINIRNFILWLIIAQGAIQIDYIDLGEVLTNYIFFFILIYKTVKNLSLIDQKKKL